ncbi:hypothetical protein [Streptomyces sp. NPDC057301]|uniref:hypothetical protein n=1 Tax=Streptomyces sp. NPDC057301 TaxID=3346093 RepID=UPI00363D9CE8
MPNGDSQVAAVGLDGRVFHAVRARSGEWTPFHPVRGIRGTGTFPGNQVAVTGLPDGSTRLLLSTR